jgi:cyclohexanone monooxygenase
VRLIKGMQAAGAKEISVKQTEFDRYNEWMSSRFESFSQGSRDCNSYYRNDAGRAPFLFPGNFKQYKRVHKESGLHEYHYS